MAKQFKINFADIPDNTVPEGKYTAKINKVELKQGQKAPYLNWEFDIIDEEYLDRKVWLMTSFSDNALFRLKQVAEALGFEGGFDFETDESNMVVEPQLAGTEVKIDVMHTEYQGQKRAQVKTVLDYYTDFHLGGDPEEADDEDEFEDFDDDADEDEPFEEEDDVEEIGEEIEEPEAVAPVTGKKPKK